MFGWKSWLGSGCFICSIVAVRLDENSEIDVEFKAETDALFSYSLAAHLTAFVSIWGLVLSVLIILVGLWQVHNGGVVVADFWRWQVEEGTSSRDLVAECSPWCSFIGMGLLFSAHRAITTKLGRKPVPERPNASSSLFSFILQ